MLLQLSNGSKIEKDNLNTIRVFLFNRFSIKFLYYICSSYCAVNWCQLDIQYLAKNKREKQKTYWKEGV